MVMDIICNEIKSLGKEVLARIHDAIFIDAKLSNYDRQNIEFSISLRFVHPRPASFAGAIFHHERPTKGVPSRTADVYERSFTARLRQVS